MACSSRCSRPNDRPYDRAVVPELRELAPVPEGRPWGYYSVDETAAKYNASSPEETQDGFVAYAHFAPAK